MNVPLSARQGPRDTLGSDVRGTGAGSSSSGVENRGAFKSSSVDSRDLGTDGSPPTETSAPGA